MRSYRVLAAQGTERCALQTLPEVPASPSAPAEPSPSRPSSPPSPDGKPAADVDRASAPRDVGADVRLARAARRRKEDAAMLRGTRQGKLGMYRRKVAPGAQALKEAAHARYLADMRAHFDEVMVLQRFVQVFSTWTASEQRLFT